MCANWVSARQQADAASLSYPFMELLGRYFEEPGLKVESFDLERLAPKLHRLSEDLDPPTNWSKFFAKSGKVIFASASNDYITNSHGHILAYQAVVAESGAAAASKGMRAAALAEGVRWEGAKDVLNRVVGNCDVPAAAHP